jgi:AraC-like DNA-binding protein
MSVNGRDPDSLATVLSSSVFPAKVLKSCNNNMRFNCEFMASGPITLGRASYEGSFECRKESDNRKILTFLPLAGAVQIHHDCGDLVSRPGRATVIQGERSNWIRFDGPRSHLSICFDRNYLVGKLSTLMDRNIKAPLMFEPMFNINDGCGQTFFSLVEVAYNGLQEGSCLQKNPLALMNICEAITHVFLWKSSHQYSEALSEGGPTPSPRHVKRAIEYMTAHMHKPICVEELAAVSNVSVRSLQQGFKQFKMTTPMSYLQGLRLDAAHTELLKSESRQTVSAIAMRWGFVHLGRFSAEYARRFGEMPSETLRRPTSTGSK